jgi:hypothetical protein
MWNLEGGMFDFGLPWRDDFNLLAPKGRKKELELI